MTRTEHINELATALAKAQSEILNAKKDSENPHFRSKYADLGSVWDAIRAALTKHGLSVVQSPRLITTGEQPWFVEVETTMLHASGQSLSDVLAMPLAAPTAHGVGSACTYARRYALAAFAGVAAADDDDDGNAAVSAPVARETTKRAKVPSPAALPEGLETVVARVMGIVKRPIKDGAGTKYLITCDDQSGHDSVKTYGTFSLTDATMAKAAQEAGLPLEITFKTTQYGRDITALHEIVPADEPPL